MTEFQVGDRVSVEGVVTVLEDDIADGYHFVSSATGELYRLWHEDMTLVDRPSEDEA